MAKKERNRSFPLKIAAKNCKYTAINLTKDVRDSDKNDKTLTK